MKTLLKTKLCYSTAPTNKINATDICFCCTFPELWCLDRLLELGEKEKKKYKIAAGKGVKFRFLFTGFKKAN